MNLFNKHAYDENNALKNKFTPDKDSISIENDSFPKRAAKKQLMPGNIYHAKKDFTIDGVS